MHTHTRVILVRAHVGKKGGFSNGQANHIPGGLESGHCLFMRYILQVTIIHLNKDRGSCNRKHDISWCCTTLREVEVVVVVVVVVVVGGGGGGGDGQVTVIHLNKDSKHLYWKAWHWCYTIGWRWGMAGGGGGGGGQSIHLNTDSGSCYKKALQWCCTIIEGLFFLVGSGGGDGGGGWGVICFQSLFHYLHLN